MTPRQARAARALLGLDLKTVCALADVGKRTLTEFEAGARAINRVTQAKIMAFYISKGISFSAHGMDGEGVSFVARNEHRDQASTEIRNKTEYYDVFNVSGVMQRIGVLNDTIESLEQEFTISQSITLELMRRTGLNQKALADQLGCTPSFISAVVLGKKSLPLQYASDVQTILNELSGFDVARALQQERKIEKQLAGLKTLITDYSMAWRLIHPSTY